MYEEGSIMNQAKLSLCGAQIGIKADITIGENIEAQIASLKTRIKELEDTRDRISATGLLTARIDDLQRAMRY